MDVVLINRYYGWYNLSGDLEAAKFAFRKELDWWEEQHKPVILSEYGADTIAGLHGAVAEKTAELFVRLAPGEDPDFPDGHDDKTHFNAYGADRICSLAVEGMKRIPACVPFLKQL